MSLGRYYRRIVVVPQGLFDPDQVNVIEISLELRDEPVVIAAIKQFQIKDSITSLELITQKYSSDKIRPKTADAYYVDHKAETCLRSSGQRLKRRNEHSQTLGDRAVKEWLNCFSSPDDNGLLVNTVSQINTVVLGDANSSSSCSGLLTPYDVEIMLSCMSNMNLPIGDEDTSTPDDQDMMMIPMQQVLSRITEDSEYTYTTASSPKEPDDNYKFEATSSTATCRSSTSEVNETKKSASFTIIPSTNSSCEIDQTTNAPIVVAAESSSNEVVFDTEDHQTNTTDFADETSSESFATTAGSTKGIHAFGVASSATEIQENIVEKKISCTQISSGHVKEVRCDIELYLKEVENVEIRQLHRDLTNYQLARRRCFLGGSME